MKTLLLSQLTKEDTMLVENARHATTLSYSPYSQFKVGTAVLLENGHIIKGANLENASYPVGICAERSAIATANNLYPDTPIKAIALAARNRCNEFTDEVITPCGMCRQAIAEWEKRYNRSIRIIMSSTDKVIIADSISELLPMSFS